MLSEEDSPVVLDTDVWSLLFGPPTDQAAALRQRLSGLLAGRSTVIATQTRAEVMMGIEYADWGDRRRLNTRRQLDRTAVIPVNEPVVEAFAKLYARSRRAGHALSQPEHGGDRWIAASAIAISAPLLSLDRIFRNAPELTLLEGNGRNDG